VIFPVPVTLKRFLALEFVLTFGIFILLFYTLLADLTGGHLSGLVGNQVMVNLKWDAKVGIFCNQLAIGNWQSAIIFQQSAVSSEVQV